MKLVNGALGLLAGVVLAVQVAPALADQSDPANKAPNIRSESNRETRQGYKKEGASWISTHVKSYPGNGNSDFAPASSKANDKSRSNPSRSYTE
jgi:hypothetical protein